jgi:general secretion pathway protein G
MNSKSNPTRSADRSAGFTLVEIMVVIVIIGVLATLVVPNVIGASDEAREQTAKTNCMNIAQSVQLYRTKKGTLPKSLADLNSEEEKGKSWYLQDLPKDPWDRDYELREDGNEWEVISGGKNQSIGDEDDISNRTKKDN